MGKKAPIMSRITSLLLLGLWASLMACGQSSQHTATPPPLDPTVAPPAAPAAQDRVVYINGVRVTEAQLQQYEQMYQVTVQPGRYWYDRVSGLWGLEGDWSLGQVLPNLDLGGPMRADASGGTSEVFFNGRRLNAKEIAWLQRFTPVYPGRYWLDPYGNVGLEGGPILGNLVQMASAAGAGGGGGGNSTFYRNGYTGIGGGSDGNTHYVIGSDFSVIVGD